MKTLGILGGMSWESTAKYYAGINRAVNARLGGLHSGRLLISSFDMEPMAERQREDRWQEAGEILSAEAVKLQQAGADAILLATNTKHKVAPVIEAAIDVPFLHLADATAQKITDAGIEKIGLLGTIYTMEHDFYKDRLVAHGLDPVVPEKADREEVSRVIFEELCLGKLLDTSRDTYVRIIEDMAKTGAQGVILGCTEIGLLIGAQDVSIPVFDTTDIHIEAAVDFMLS